ncbi:MAG: NYN domain-containing protein [Chitinispirillales bacterium]|nr:NYN domain-containing protein [Chitinispirillales bacterium]
MKAIYGEFRITTNQCHECGRTFETFEEKETDVNIAIKIFEQAYLNSFDTAIILPGDSDQVPAIRAIKKNFPSKKIGVLIPPGRRANFLKQEADFYFKIKHKQLTTSQLPESITCDDGSQIHCPERWKSPVAVV